MTHFPSGTSIQNVLHYAQSINSGKFQKFDFGKKGNQKHYHQDTPPEYPLSAWNVPSIIFYGEKDLLADPTDILRTLSLIPKPLVVQEVKDYGHADFVWGVDANSKVYNPILQMIQKYCP